MPTMIAIDDDVLPAVERLALERHQTVGEVISSLARQSLPEPSIFETVEGVPQIPSSPHSRRVTFDMVKRLQDELGV